MKGFFKKSIAVAMALFLLLPVLAGVTASAATEETAFVFDSLRGGGESYPAVNEITLPLGEAGVTYTANGLSMMEGETNAFYVSLSNASNATALRVTYSYETYGIISSETVEQPLQQIAEKQSIVFYAPHVSGNVTALSLSFVTPAPATGTVTVYAFFNFSTYAPQDTGDASFSACHYDQESNSITITGDLSYAATVRYEGQTLALFALSAGESLHLSNKTPIARTSISFNFSFQIKVNGSEDVFSRYVVAALTQNGDRIPLCSPIYPSLPAAGVRETKGFKGFHSQSLSTELEVMPGASFVDVYIDRLLPQVTPTDSIPYAGENSYYYFAKAYLDEIDRKVQNMTGLGSDVYLRFLISGDANGRSFTDYSEKEEQILNKLPAIRSEEARREVYAITAFLTERYVGSNLCGIVLGRSANLSNTYSFADCDSLADYSELYVCALNLIAGAARSYIPDLHVILPLSDRIWSERISEDALEGEYPTALFLNALFSALEAQILDPQAFCVMMETESLPDRLSPYAESFYGMDRFGGFMQLLQPYTKYAYFEDEISLSFAPQATVDEASLKAAYLLYYGTLYQNGRIKFFMADFSIAEEKGTPKLSESLAYLAQYIDTDRIDEAASSALKKLGAATVAELFPGFDTAFLLHRQIHRLSLSSSGYEKAAEIKGSYKVFDFTTATGTLDWYAGSNCNNLSVLTDSTNSYRSLTAKILAGQGTGSIAYHFNTPTDLSFAPLMKLDLGITAGNAGQRYELRLSLLSETDTVTASTILSAGERSVLYFDLSQDPALLQKTHCVRLEARALDGATEDFNLCLYTVALESEQLDSGELSKRVNEILKTTTAPQAEQKGDRVDYTVPLVVTALIIMASAAAVTPLALKRRTARTPKQQ